MATDIDSLKGLQRGRAPALRDSQTQENLEAAFSSDSQTIQLYGYFAKIARIEGYGDAARLFEEMAESQAKYTHGHLDFLKRVGEPLARRRMGETQHNLLAGIAIEELDAANRLEDMARTAHAEGLLVSQPFRLKYGARCTSQWCRLRTFLLSETVPQSHRCRWNRHSIEGHG